MSNKHEASSNDDEVKKVIALEKPGLSKIFRAFLGKLLTGLPERSTEDTNATKVDILDRPVVGETITGQRTDALVEYLFKDVNLSIWEKFLTGEYDFNKEIIERFGLLIHKDEANFNENRIVENDCTILREALMTEKRTKERDEQRQRIFITSSGNSESMFWCIIAKREDEILKGLQAYFTNFTKKVYHWNPSEKKTKEIFNDMYLRIRVLKALHIHCDKKNIEYPNALVQILNAVKYRWQEAYEVSSENRGEWLSRNKILADKTKERNASYFVREYKRLLKKSKDAHLKGPELRKFADDIFCESMYLSGFPNHPHASEYLMNAAFAPIFQASFDKIRSAIPPTDLEKNEDISKFIQELFHIIAICLSLFNFIEEVRDRWLWIHVSGHGSGVLLPKAVLNNLDDMIIILSELFSHTAISMDCCYPYLGFKGPNRTLALFPNECRKKTRYSNMFSDFTSLLSFALEGFHCEGCYPRMKSVFWSVQQCTCRTCKEYRMSLVPPEGERIRNQLSAVYCGHCKKLRERCTGERRGLIYTADIYEYLRKHLCSKIYDPQKSTGSAIMDEVPLMKLT